MRRKEFEVTDYKEMLEIAAQAQVCRIALADGAYPYVVPMNFGYEDKDGQLILYFHCADKGKKISLIEANGGAASFEIDAAHELITAKSGCGYTFHYKCIMGTGKIEFVEGLEEKTHAFRQIMRQYAGDGDMPLEENRIKHTCVLKLTAESWSCKARPR